ncbi:MAG TPA: SIMPL domain-containing protein [Hyphomicrobiaceae bacterium]|nr:SIMPL domain-containing protein [Hyphomicrobiaceae bacterium]
MLRHNMAVAFGGLALATTLLLATAGLSAEGDAQQERTVSVSATGSVVAEPDLAMISTGVVSEADTAREALSRNTATMAKVIDGLKALGISAQDIRTTSLNVEPRYRSAKDQAPSIVGYQVVNQVRITARELKRLGEVLDQIVGLGVNQIGGIAFEVSKAEELRDEARKMAMANALRRARLYAASAGADVGAVLMISEDAPAPAPRPMARTSLAASDVPIEPGTQRLEVKVYVTWALR